ncbi:GAF domain-containing sensor histidine kinase [Neolewinella aurantiaca]|uniref:histidine kinase n=1 Tax=Neolewinella aurantiaca TaxID=2602767 RepID=A0A5C7FRT2_9BACT|nr:GAF domain-containing sensor histidine kinase [Neolewinella aurantiaca]TXF89069.1 GAF domain-containing sensor histidine kinase [Neolewinella aurantiaca]
MKARIPVNEAERLENLRQYEILDTGREQEYDDLTAIASQICGTPVSMISLIDEDRQWYKSTVGVDPALTETGRDVAFCAHNILDASGPLVIKDMREDPRFSDNPFVSAAPNAIFYAGAPLVTDEGHALGSICVVDLKPRELTEEQVEALTALSRQVIKLLELRKSLAATRHQYELKAAAHKNLLDFSYVVAHDLKAPLRNIGQFAELVTADYGQSIPEDGREMLAMMGDLTKDAQRMISGVLKYSEAVTKVDEEREVVDLREVVEAMKVRLLPPPDCRVEFVGPVGEMYASKLAVEQVLQNLISNAIKYRDKPETVIEVGYQVTEDGAVLSVRDNGRGISERAQRSIFNLFYTTAVEGEEESHGVGLSIVKRMAELLRGEIKIASEEGQWSEFSLVMAG